MAASAYPTGQVALAGEVVDESMSEPVCIGYSPLAIRIHSMVNPAMCGSVKYFD